MTSAMYEFMAAAFYRQTGVMAPGKSLPLEMCGSSADDDEMRAEYWKRWLKSPQADDARERFQDDLRDTHAEYMNESSGLSDDEAREIEEVDHG